MYMDGNNSQKFDKDHKIYIKEDSYGRDDDIK